MQSGANGIGHSFRALESCNAHPELAALRTTSPPTKLRDSHSKRAAYRNGYGSEKELPKGPQVRPSLVNIKVGAERLVEDSWGCLIKGQCSHPIPVGNFWSQCQISSASFPAHMQCGKPNNNRFPMLP